MSDATLKFVVQMNSQTTGLGWISCWGERDSVFADMRSAREALRLARLTYALDRLARDQDDQPDTASFRIVAVGDVLDAFGDVVKQWHMVVME